MGYIEKIKSEIYEELADIEHTRWGDWQEYMHSKGVPRHDGVLFARKDIEHWERQIKTRYCDLTEREKASDREQVDRYWPLIEARLKEAYQKGLLLES